MIFNLKISGIVFENEVEEEQIKENCKRELEERGFKVIELMVNKTEGTIETITEGAFETIIE